MKARSLPLPPAPGRPLLTLAMIARNEARNIGDAISSARSLVDRIVVVDTGSTDDTMGIALRLGARVIVRPWDDSFPNAYNAALSNCFTPWAFILDCDERLHMLPGAQRRIRQKLRSIRQGWPNVCVGVRVENPDGSGGFASPRLFPVDPRVRYGVSRAHPQLLGTRPDGTWSPLEGDVTPYAMIVHDGYARDSYFQKGKWHRTRLLLNLDLAEHPNDEWTDFIRELSTRHDGIRQEEMPL